MLNTPKSLRLQIGIFGRTNVGKSSFLNMIANQDVAIISEIPGTTTDVVEKSIELLPVGPVTLLDTAGFGDVSELSDSRIDRSYRIFDRADVAVLVIEPNVWTDFEDEIYTIIKSNKTPFIIAINKIDTIDPSEDFLKIISKKSKHILQFSANDLEKRNDYISEFKSELLKVLPKDALDSKPLIRDLIPEGGLCILIVPIDMEAPKGRIILPQVQTIRDILDGNSIAIVVKETEYSETLKLLNRKPDLVVCDSQVVFKMVAETPDDIPCTTFSILFSRLKGDLDEEVKGLNVLNELKNTDKILIAESCSHHPMEDDIGRIKIPKWLQSYLNDMPEIEVANGRDYPANLKDYKLIIHCGACMLTRNEKLIRIEKAKQAGVPITNYGIVISQLHNVLERVLTPFPETLKLFKSLNL